MCDIKLLGSNRYGAMAISSVSFGSGLKFEVRDPNFGTSQLKIDHAVALMDHQNPLGYPNISHWSHGCDMKLLGSNRYGAMTISSVSFGSDLKSEKRILTHPSSKWLMAWSSCDIKFPWDTQTSIIGPIGVI
jgi:hypothetical protein